MTRVLVTGGTGVLGSALLPYLLDADYTVRIMSRSPRRAGYDERIEWAQAELESGHGLAEAVKDVDVIVHAASDPFRPRQVDVQGTEKLLRHAATAGVGHIIYISIVAIDRIPYYYYQAKLEVERMIERGAVPWTILRATPFHSLMPKMFLLPAIKTPLIALVPKAFKFQPIDEREAALRVAELVEAGPSGRVADIGGPEVLTLEEIARTYLEATGQRKPLVNLPLPGKTAAGLRSGYGAMAPRYGKVTWAEWLERTYGTPERQPTGPARQRAEG